jgi:hypothetical protein
MPIRYLPGLSGTVTGVNLAGSPVTILTLPAPTTGSTSYRVNIVFSNLNVNHSIVAQEFRDPLVLKSQPFAFGTAIEQVQVFREMHSGESSWAIQAQDISALSNNATITWDTYEAESSSADEGLPPIIQVDQIGGIDIVVEQEGG